jgi:hypothetical protein
MAIACARSFTIGAFFGPFGSLPAWRVPDLNSPITFFTFLAAFLFPVSCFDIDDLAIAILTLPRSEAFIDAAVRVFRSLGTCELLLHALHSGTERITPCAALWLGSLQPRLLWVRCIVGSPAFGVQTALGRLPFLALPCRSLVPLVRILTPAQFES